MGGTEEKEKLHRGKVLDAGAHAHDDRDAAEYAVSQVGRQIKEKSTIHLAQVQVYAEKKRNFTTQHF